MTKRNRTRAERLDSLKNQAARLRMEIMEYRRGLRNNNNRAILNHLATTMAEVKLDLMQITQEKRKPRTDAND